MPRKVRLRGKKHSAPPPKAIRPFHRQTFVGPLADPVLPIAVQAKLESLPFHLDPLCVLRAFVVQKQQVTDPKVLFWYSKPLSRCPEALPWSSKLLPRNSEGLPRCPEVLPRYSKALPR
jgi:hypothetical protein